MNPLDIAIIRGRLQQITDEMDVVHTKAAFSPVVSEMSDRANAIIDPERLEVVSQGKTGLPVFVSAMQAAARSIMKILGPQLRDGDVIIMNDPYLGGTHLQDVKLLRPFYFGGELTLLLVSTGHYVDMGGASAAGFDPGATDIFQEGLQIPPVFLRRNGEVRSDVLRLIVQNTRLPEAQEGDIRAQLNALDIGARRLTALIEERGADQLRQAIAELADRSEEQMRGYLRRIPDGTYRGRDTIEISRSEELTIQIALTFKNGSVEVDFTGSSPTYRGPMNLAWPTTETAVYLTFKHFFPEVPINGGCFRPFTFKCPPGSFLNASWPNAVGGFPEGAQRISDALFIALATALPDLACGGSFGTGGTVTFSGYADDGSFFASMFPMCGGYGGSKGSDGLVHGPTPIGLAQFPKLEASEHDYPGRWDALELRPDSAGAGRWRGGPGTVFRFKALTPMTISFLGDRARFGPSGAVGGGAAALTEISVKNKDGINGGRGYGQIKGIKIEPGDWVEMKSAGGGGYGPASERDPAAIAADVRDQIVSASGHSK
jgi:N-methylhydantoinase B